MIRGEPQPKEWGFAIIINDSRRKDGGCLRTGYVMAINEKDAKEQVNEVIKLNDRGEGGKINYVARNFWKE